ncbi:uncharacterized protein LOC129899859 [Solanum dulcamara]|uniref:uncharacterized protein LOC129899859 n=1 Tax=Solanum dulcamara TaxID=45834 RepID=UPI002486099D|nr:uncharacterized protein LOC129899859 [Solanum dulcamara]
MVYLLKEMKGTRRGKSRRGGIRTGRGNFQGRESLAGTASQPQIPPRQGPLQTEQSSNPRQGPQQISQISNDPIQRTSLETQSSRTLEESFSRSPYYCFAVSRINKKRGRGKYKSKTVDIKTKYGGKINIIIPYDIDRAVGSGARDIVNYCGLIMRSSISFRDGNWQKIVLKHGEAMWYKVKDKFEFCGGLREHKLQGFVISTMQRLFRAWKARLHNSYSAYDTDEERLSHRPEDVELEDWKYLVKYFGSEKFKVVSERNKKNREKQITKHSCGTRSFAEVDERNPESGEKDTPDKVWEIQHTRKKDNGERVWFDLLQGQLQQLVVEQQSEEIEHPMTRDEILSSVLGEISVYVREKGYGKKPPKKSQLHKSDIEASVSSAMESIRQEMQADMDRKLQEEREQMTADLKKNMKEDLQKKLDEECEHMKGEVDKMFQEQMAAIMTRMQQGQGSYAMGPNQEVV